MAGLAEMSEPAALHDVRADVLRPRLEMLAVSQALSLLGWQSLAADRRSMQRVIEVGG